MIAKVIETGESIQVEEVADLVDGQHIFLATKFPLYDSSGEIYGVVLFPMTLRIASVPRSRCARAKNASGLRQGSPPDGFTILRPVRDEQGRVVDFTWGL